jgi:hypothetical protein
MIGVYIVLRAFEIICRSEAQFTSGGSRAFVQIVTAAAIVVATVALLCGYCPYKSECEAECSGTFE